MSIEAIEATTTIQALRKAKDLDAERRTIDAGAKALRKNQRPVVFRLALKLLPLRLLDRPRDDEEYEWLTPPPYFSCKSSCSERSSSYDHDSISQVGCN